MEKYQLEKITFSEILKEAPPYMIKNFILSNSDNKTDLLFDYPFSFEGAVMMTFIKGEANVKISFKEFHIDRNTVLTILPNQIVEVLDYSEDLFVEILVFSNDFLSDLPIPNDFDLYRKVNQEPALKVSEKDIQNLLRYHSFIAETFNNKDHHFLEKVIKGLLLSLLVEIMNLYSHSEIGINEKGSSRSKVIVEEFMLLLKDHYQIGRTASYYSNKMFITPKYLSSTLKKVTGRPINQWIDDAIVTGAKLLLKSTNMTVLQISEELNFPNPSYFGRFFKRKTEMTPLYYREN